MLKTDPELERLIDNFDFNKLTPSQQREFDALILALERDRNNARYLLDPLRFALSVLPHHFSLDVAHIHRRIVKLAFPGCAQDRKGSESRGKIETSPLPCSSPSEPNTKISSNPKSEPTKNKSAAVKSGCEPTHENSAAEKSGGMKDGEGAGGNQDGIRHIPGESESGGEESKEGEGQCRDGESTSPDPRVSNALAESLQTQRAGGIGPLLLALAAPRGFAKSTLCSFLLPTWSICLNRKHFIILISNTQAQAKKFLQMIRYEFETNEELKRQFPELKPNKDKWSDEEIELKRNGELAHKIVAIGAGAQLRGLRFLQYRPDLIILDDVENEEMVDSEIRREDLKAWLDRTVLHVNAQADVVVIGTVLHEVSLLNRLVRQHLDEDKRAYSHWKRRVFQALEFDKSTWEAYQSTESLHTLRENDPESFNQEKQNEPVGLGYKSFDKAEFWLQNRFRSDMPSELMISITCDPASTNKEYSDETAISVAGWDSKARLWVLDLEHDKYTEPDQIIDRMLFHWQRWSEYCQNHKNFQMYALGVGKIAFQKYLMNQFNQICRLRGFRPTLKELKEDRDKTRRIRQLVPLFVQDRIFLRPEMTYLEQQLRAFPKGRYDDCADALAGHLQLGHILPNESEPEDKDQVTTFKDYVDMAEEWKMERRRLSPFGTQISVVPMLWPTAN